MNIEKEKTAELEWFEEHFNASPGDKKIKIPAEVLMNLEDYHLFAWVATLYYDSESIVIYNFAGFDYFHIFSYLRDYKDNELIELKEVYFCKSKYFYPVKD